ncbi:MAG TPA: hypothetical protein VGU61_15135 [Noviherbaspirillum sp.]|jgi:hypothetical protein|uniref:hypothetical protein n=1 Tax=Noviherbaspirillum sp. TaxID=1926288 RepID=UPI002DDD2F21|nr:hypothetical protein [Noviherbaspirillum sp.]HEV2611602.1 hypothetical protein [Noviherbaspirillum sp.]
MDEKAGESIAQARCARKNGMRRHAVVCCRALTVWQESPAIGIMLREYGDGDPL